MIFSDRTDAGKKLAGVLKEYAERPDTLVIALPRGGVVVGFEISKALHLPLDIVCPRKIGAPLNPELAIGAITETGEKFLNDDYIKELGVSEEYIEKSCEKEKKEAKRRIDHYRQGRPPPLLKDQCVILVDDGLATGATMRAAVYSIRAEKAKSIVMAVPVAPLDTLARLEKEADKVICLASPSTFYAVGQFYNEFSQTTDQEVINLLL